MRAVRQTPRAINKPMLIVGVERSLLAVILCFAVVAASKLSIPLGIALLCGGCYAAKLATRKDADFLRVARQAVRLKPIYDPWKRITK